MTREGGTPPSRPTSPPTRGPGSGAASPPLPRRGIGAAISFRSRLLLGVVTAAVVPLAGFGFVILAVERARTGAADPIVGGVFLFAIAAAAIVGVVFSFFVTASLSAPLRSIAAAVDRVSAGDLSATIEIPGDDELARLADSHNRLAADLERRNRELGRILLAIGATSLRDDVDTIARRAGRDVRDAFELIDAVVVLGDPGAIPVAEQVPGEAREVRSMLSVPDERLGIIVGRLPATRSWDPADQDLLDLFASELAVSIRNAQLFAQVEAQTRRLVELGEAKDDFLRGVSHNLQTPLTSIRAYADQLSGERPDRRLVIIAEQSERLSRMVRQLLTVSRLESGTLKPRIEVLAPGPRVRRAWEAIGASQVPFELDDRSEGWLALADPDQLDQVLWALLDNAVKYGGGAQVEAAIEADPSADRVRIVVSDRGPGIATADAGRLFSRFERGSRSTDGSGSGLGLYVSRELIRAMGGELFLAPESEEAPGRSASFVIELPSEPGVEA